MSRLPIPGKDSGAWGDILNDYLSQVHKPDGTLKQGSVTAENIASDAVSAQHLMPNGGADGKILTYSSSATGNLVWATPSNSSTPTNLSIANDSTNTSYADRIIIESDTGADATLLAATTSHAGLLLAADKTKIDTIATNATANSTDAQLRDRSTHTGTQTANTISDFTETAQDAIGGSLQNTNTTSFTYDDVNNHISIDVKAQQSIVSDTNGLRLSGDTTTPGNSKYYGTDSGGSRGYYSLPPTGEANTASNVGVSGVGIFKGKSGVDFQFKKVNAGSNKITITDDTANNELDIDVVDASTTQKGVIQLSGDLGGTATSPTVPGLATKVSYLVASITANTLAGSDTGVSYVYFASGILTLTLPTAVGNKNQYFIKNINGQPVTVATTSSQMIDGHVGSIIISNQNTALTLMSDNSNWQIV